MAEILQVNVDLNNILWAIQIFLLGHNVLEVTKRMHCKSPLIRIRFDRKILSVLGENADYSLTIVFSMTLPGL